MAITNKLTSGMMILLALTLCAGMVHSMEGLDHNNVVIVLDASGSMDSVMSTSEDGTSVNKMDAAKIALLEVLKQVPGETHIGLLVFSASNISDPWVYPLGPRDDHLLKEAVMKPDPSGGTPLGKYIKIGADTLLEQREKQFGYGTYRLLIVTDGEAQDKRLVEKYVPEAMSRGITLDVIGVGMVRTHTLATKVHSYRNANDPASLKKAIADVFAEVADDSSDSTGEDAFAELAAIPHEAAASMLKVLATSGNHPLGTKVEQTRKGESSSSSTTTSTSSNSQSGKKKGGKPPFIFYVVLGIIVLRLLMKVLRKKR
mgnify:CR=1 FL=1